MQNSESLKCSMCGGIRTPNTDPDSVICSNCGMVITDKSHDTGLATVIGNPTKDAARKKVEINTRTIFERLKTWDTRT